jgi:hypothetical protein
MFIAAELLIFSARAPSFMISSLLPSRELVASVFSGCILISIVASGSERFGPIAPRDVLVIWVYDLLCLFIVDYIKVQLMKYFQENTIVLPDDPPFKAPPEHGEEEVGGDGAAPSAADLEAGARRAVQMGVVVEDKVTRGNAGGDRLTEYAIRRSIVDGEGGDLTERVAELRASVLNRSSAGGRESVGGTRKSADSGAATSRTSISQPRLSSSGTDVFRGSAVNMGSLRPNNPANRYNKW